MSLRWQFFGGQLRARGEVYPVAPPCDLTPEELAQVRVEADEFIREEIRPACSELEAVLQITEGQKPP